MMKLQHPARKYRRGSLYDFQLGGIIEIFIFIGYGYGGIGYFENVHLIGPTENGTVFLVPLPWDLKKLQEKIH